MKKLIALLMVCGFALTFVACGGQKSEEAAESVESATEEAVESTEEAVEEAADSVEEVVDTVAAE